MTQCGNISLSESAVVSITLGEGEMLIGIVFNKANWRLISSSTQTLRRNSPSPLRNRQRVANGRSPFSLGENRKFGSAVALRTLFVYISFSSSCHVIGITTGRQRYLQVGYISARRMRNSKSLANLFSKDLSRALRHPQTAGKR